MTSDAYDAGYAAGKDDAHAELRVWQLGDHAATCVCELCQTVRAIVEHALLAAQTPVLLPDHHIEGCRQAVRGVLSVLVPRAVTSNQHQLQALGLGRTRRPRRRSAAGHDVRSEALVLERGHGHGTPEAVIGKTAGRHIEGSQGALVA
jgi:hypothetical protein